MTSSTLQTIKVHDQGARDQLSVMIQQQEKYYRCEDYLHAHELEPIEAHDPLHVVTQCAMLVTDVPSPAPSSPAGIWQRYSNSSVRSPSTVSKFPRTSSNNFHHAAIQEHGMETSSWRSSESMFRKSQLSASEAESLVEWRRQMIDWSYSLVDMYELDREVVAVAFHLLDRYVASEVLSAENYSEAPFDRDDFQLYGIVCLSIAIKALVPFRKLTVECIIEMSRGFYTKEHITEAELEILGVLDWHVNQPTVMDFCRLYLDLFPNSLNEDMVHASCQYLAEVALDDVYFISKPASLVALSAVLLATQRFGASCDEIQGFLQNLQGLISVHTSEFDGLFRRLETLS